MATIRVVNEEGTAPATPRSGLTAAVRFVEGHNVRQEGENVMGIVAQPDHTTRIYSYNLTTGTLKKIEVDGRLGRMVCETDACIEGCGCSCTIDVGLTLPDSSLQGQCCDD